VAGQVTPEDLIGLVGVAGADQPELTGEAVLERPPKSLDAALGLRREGEDELDSNFLEQAPKLGRLTVTEELIFDPELLVLGLEEDGVTVGVNGHRDPVLGHRLAHDLEVAVGILLLSEASPRDLAGGVIDSPN